MLNLVIVVYQIEDQSLEEKLCLFVENEIQHLIKNIFLISFFIAFYRIVDSQEDNFHIE